MSRNRDRSRETPTLRYFFRLRVSVLPRFRASIAYTSGPLAFNRGERRRDRRIIGGNRGWTRDGEKCATVIPYLTVDLSPLLTANGDNRNAERRTESDARCNESGAALTAERLAARPVDIRTASRTLSRLAISREN